MKDATGELSMTAVAVVAIAAIGVVFTTLIWPQIRQNILRSTYCSQAFNCDCTKGKNNMCSCYYCPNDTSNKNNQGGGGQNVKTDDCSKPQSISCPNNSVN